MPIYEYECKECGKHFDEMQKFSDEPIKKCRFCGGEVRKLMGTPALQFKGTGWYVTDYAGKTPKPAGNEKGSMKGKTSEGAKKEKTGSAASDQPAASGASCPTTPSGNK